MPRIIVTAEPLSSRRSDDAPILLDEQVHSVHLSNGHAASQLVERLAWAISDAEDAEDALAARRARRARREHGGAGAGASASRARHAIGA